MFVKSHAHILLDNFTLTNDYITRTIYDISGKSKLEMCNAEFLLKNSTLMLFIVPTNSAPWAQDVN